jgi:hypothetical protein
MSLNTIVPARSKNAVRKPKTASLGEGRPPRPIVSATRTANPIKMQLGILISVKNAASRVGDAGVGGFNLLASEGLVVSTITLFQNKPK